jgi:hypothetical protein
VDPAPAAPDAGDLTARQAIFEGHLEQSSDGSCTSVGPLFSLGDFGDPSASPPRPSSSVPDGNGGVVGVSCIVAPASAGAFEVIGTINTPTGRFAINGQLTGSGEQSNVNAVVSTSKGTSYQDRTCVLDYPSGFPGVAAGRVWGQLTCPNAKSTNDTCKLVAQVRLENCAQQQ